MYNGQGQPLDGPILHQHVDGLADPVITTDVDGAKALLESAGWKLDEGTNIRKKNGNELAFTLSTSKISTEFVSIVIISPHFSSFIA